MIQLAFLFLSFVANNGLLFNGSTATEKGYITVFQQNIIPANEWRKFDSHKEDIKQKFESNSAKFPLSGHDFFTFQEAANGGHPPPHRFPSTDDGEMSGWLTPAYFLQNNGYGMVEHEGHGLWYGVQIMYNQDRWILNYGSVNRFIPKSPEMGEKKGRPCVTASFKHAKASHVTALVTSCHLDHPRKTRDREGNHEDCVSMLNQVGLAANPPGPAFTYRVIAGDFNECGWKHCNVETPGACVPGYQSFKEPGAVSIGFGYPRMFDMMLWGIEEKPENVDLKTLTSQAQGETSRVEFGILNPENDEISDHRARTLRISRP